MLFTLYTKITMLRRSVNAVKCLSFHISVLLQL